MIIPHEDTMHVKAILPKETLRHIAILKLTQADGGVGLEPGLQCREQCVLILCSQQ
jgi:hypothetical protein